MCIKIEKSLLSAEKKLLWTLILKAWCALNEHWNEISGHWFHWLVNFQCTLLFFQCTVHQFLKISVNRYTDFQKMMVYTDFIDWLIFSVHYFFQCTPVYENQCELIHLFSFYQSYIDLTIGWNSFSVYTVFQKQCTLINVKVFNWLVIFHCTPEIFSVHWLYIKLMIGGNLFSVYTVIFQHKQCYHSWKLQSEPGMSYKSRTMSWSVYFQLYFKPISDLSSDYKDKNAIKLDNYKQVVVTMATIFVSTY